MHRPLFARTLTTGVAIAWVGAVCFESSSRVSAAGAPAQAPVAADTPAKALVTKYCITCHNERVKTAGLLLDRADAQNVSNSADVWEKVVVQLRSRAMPPTNMPRPDGATYAAVATWLEGELDRAALARPNPGRPADLHRLNRTEYANAVRDLLGIELDAPAMLPPDAQAHGFDTNADALGMEPALLDRYLTAAAKIARVAIGDSTLRPAVERYTAVKGNSNEPTWLWQTERLGESFSLGSRGGIAARHYFPLDGEYDFRVRLLRTYAGVIRGLNAPTTIEIRVDGNRLGQFTIGGPSPAAPAGSAERPDATEPSDDLDSKLQVRVAVKAGLREVLATIVKTESVKAEGMGPARVPIWNREGDVPSAEMAISSLLIGGPYNGRVPEDSPSRRRIFVCQPTGTGDETACATRILSTLARRARTAARQP
jgi:mono/diheme cytochrome c family protein